MIIKKSFENETIANVVYRYYGDDKNLNTVLECNPDLLHYTILPINSNVIVAMDDNEIDEMEELNTWGKL